MTILGLGTDIIEIERIRKSFEKHGSHFAERLFTPKEIEYCVSHKNAHTHFAGRFAAKEAIAKAFGTGIGKEIAWKDIEILNGENGEPVVFFSATLQKRFSSYKVFLSISHSKEYATATALLISL